MKTTVVSNRPGLCDLKNLIALEQVVAGQTDKVGAAKTASFLLPDKITELVKAGVELGTADDQVFGR